MTNVFSDQEEAVAESGCLVMDTPKDGPGNLWLLTSMVTEELIQGLLFLGLRSVVMELGAAVPGDAGGAASGGPCVNLGVLPHVVPGRKSPQERGPWLLLPPGQGATFTDRPQPGW